MAWKITDHSKIDTSMITPVGTVFWNTVVTDDPAIADYFRSNGSTTNGMPRYTVEEVNCD